MLTCVVIDEVCLRILQIAPRASQNAQRSAFPLREAIAVQRRRAVVGGPVEQKRFSEMAPLPQIQQELNRVPWQTWPKVVMLLF